MNNEKKNKTDFTLLKTRSTGAAIRDGYNLYLDYFRNIFRATWLISLFYAVFTGLLTTFFINDSAHMLSLMLAVRHHPEDATVMADFLKILLAICTLYTGVTALLASFGFSLLKQHSQSNTISQPAHWYGYCQLKVVGRTLFSWLLMLLLVHCYLAAFATIINTVKAHISTIALGALTLMLLTLMLISIPPLMMRFMRYILSDDNKKPFSHKFPLRYWGTTLAIAIVVTLVISLLSIITELPANILFSANMQSQTGTLIGDPTGMPEYMSWLNFIVFMFAGFIQAYVLLSSLFPFYYLHGSIATQEKEREELTKKFSQQTEHTGTNI